MHPSPEKSAKTMKKMLTTGTSVQPPPGLFDSTKDVLIVPRTIFYGESDFEVRKIIGVADFEKNQLLYTSK